MRRVNVMLDETAESAGAYLAQELGGVGMSAAIRFALFQMAKRKGWKPESVMERRARRATSGPDGEG